MAKVLNKLRITSSLKLITRYRAAPLPKDLADDGEKLYKIKDDQQSNQYAQELVRHCNSTKYSNGQADSNYIGDSF